MMIRTTSTRRAWRSSWWASSVWRFSRAAGSAPDPRAAGIEAGESEAGTKAGLLMLDEHVVVRARRFLGHDAAGFVVALYRELVEFGQDRRVLADERHELFGRQMQSHRRVDGDDVGGRRSPEHQRDLAHDVARAKGGQHERLVAFHAHDGH